MLRSVASRTARRLPLRAPAPAAAFASSAAPSADLDWATLGFAYQPTKTMIRYNWKDGSWDNGVMSTDFDVKIHSLSNVLHYGQGIFEGLKAFHCADGTVRTFNDIANVARLRRGAERLLMPVVSEEMFRDGCDRVLRDNVEYIPPFGHGGAMYLRPFLFGHGGALGLGPAPQYSFCVVGCPVGAYYKGGLQAIDAMVVENWDRAAPRGVGSIKVAGNYAPDVLPSSEAKKKGFPICLYLDAKTNSYVEEFSTSNFIGITKQGSLVTPASDSILPSTTKGVLLQAARDVGLQVEERPLAWDEVPELAEVAAVGTAVVLTPIQSITRAEVRHEFGGMETVSKLYNAVTGIQTAELPDPHGYTRVVCEKPLQK